MRIALITLHTPTKTNFGGASALPFHLAKFRPDDIKMEIWSFNCNECDSEQISASEAELGLKIHILDTPWKMHLLSFKFIRLILPLPYQDYLSVSNSSVNEINNYLGNNIQNGLWIYGEELAGLARRFHKYKTLVTTPDCEALYYQRMFGMKGVGLSWKWLSRYALMYRKYCRHTAALPVGDNITYHLVGKEDQILFNKLHPAANSLFIRHPHYEITPQKSRNIEKGKLKILIAGRNNVYMADAAEVAIESICDSNDQLAKSYAITFLGMGWDALAKHGAVANFCVLCRLAMRSFTL